MNDPSTTSRVAERTESLRQHTGNLAYAAAIGYISEIARTPVPTPDADRVAEIRDVLDALDILLAEEAPRGTDDAEEHAPKPAGVDGFTHERGQPFGVVES